MPAKAGNQSTRYRIFWIPAFAGMTVYLAIKPPNAKINQIDQTLHLTQHSLTPALQYSITPDILTHEPDSSRTLCVLTFLSADQESRELLLCR